MPNRCTLVIDSSSSPLLLALAHNGRVFAARRKGIKQEKILFPLLQRLQAKAGVQLTHVERIFIVRGPGRFTGIRIALTLASMLEFLNHTRVLGATVFEVVREQVLASRAFKTWQRQHPSGALAVVLHAFREEYFLQIFDDQQAGPQWLTRSELLARLAQYEGPLFVAGTDKEGAPLDGLLGTAYPLAAYKDCRVRPQTLCRLAQQDKWQANALEPLYLKPARFEQANPQ